MPVAGLSPAPSLPARYRIERELGQGAMAVVYLAMDATYGRRVAVKVMRPDLVASVGAERFLREINIAAQLAHPHILPLIDSGATDERLYLVTPYVPGGSLRERIKGEGPQPLPVAMRIIDDIGSALDYVHRSGFVHRDVKPGNILFFAEGQAVLADFGVAQVCYEPGVDVLTDSGLAIGTPAYMSPEQASGERVESRTDIYSLACVLYEMLAGVPPFQANGVRALLAKHVTEAAPSVRGRRPEIPSNVDRAIAKAMAKDPADRFATVAEFLSALHAPVPAVPRSAVRTRSIAVLPFVNATADPETEYLSDGITDELIVALAKVSGLRVASRTSVFALKGKPQDVRATGVVLGVSVVLEGSVRRLGDRLRITAQLTATDTGQVIWSQRYDRTMGDLFALQDEMASTIVNTLRATSFADLSEPLARRYTDNEKAYALYLRGRHAWNKRTQEGVLEGAGYFERAIAADPNYALAYTGLSDSYALQVDYRDVPVAEGFERAKSYARQAIAIDDSLAEAHASLAWTLFIHDWDWEGATREFRRAIELDPRYASSHQWFSFLLLSQGHADEGLLEAHTALELDPASVSVRRSVAHMYFYARRYDQAVYHIERAIALDPTAVENHRLLGMFLTQQERHEEALSVLRDAVDMSGGSAGVRAMYGQALARAGRADETRTILEDLEARSRHSYVSPVVFVNLHLGLRAWDRALDAMDRAYTERRGWLVYLNVNPMVDPVREQPRFKELVNKMGLGAGTALVAGG